MQKGLKRTEMIAVFLHKKKNKKDLKIKTKRKEKKHGRQIEVKCSKISFSSHLLWTFCKYSVWTVFELALFFKSLLTCVFEDDHDKRKFLLFVFLLASHVTLVETNVCSMILTFQANCIPCVNGLYM